MNPFVSDNLRYTLQGKKILLGITGSIAAFKACDIVRYLRECGAFVKVILSQGAENFVTSLTLETLSGAPVLKDFWSHEQGHGTYHIDTARWADLILVAPATAHFLAKASYGFADDLLSTEILAFRGPLLIAPAMNPAMFENPAVQENISRLKDRGVRFLGPISGKTACGEEGLGRMLEPEQIVEKVSSAFHLRNDRHLLITLGPTRSSIDPVRYLTNRSSGLMGASLCWAAVQKGYPVTAICGPIQCKLPEDVQLIRVETAKEMANAALENWKTSQIFISAAAVLDWDIQTPSLSKLKKNQGPPQLRLEKNIDILATLSQDKRKDQFVLGFAAETDDPIQNGFKKLREKGCNAIFANDVSNAKKGFESSFNGGWWLTLPDQVVPFETSSKTELARKMIQRLSYQSLS